MKIFRRIKRWLRPPKPPTLEQMKDLVEVTIMNLTTEDFHLAFDTKQQYLLAWIGNRYCSVSFNIVTLFGCRDSVKNFVNYVRFQLRKVGIES